MHYHNFKDNRLRLDLAYKSLDCVIELIRSEYERSLMGTELLKKTFIKHGVLAERFEVKYYAYRTDNDGTLDIIIYLENDEILGTIELQIDENGKVFLDKNFCMYDVYFPNDYELEKSKLICDDIIEYLNFDFSSWDTIQKVQEADVLSKRLYKLKHVPTGLYFQPKKHRGSNLSKNGKVYHTATNGISNDKDKVYISTHKDTIIYKETKDILDWTPSYNSEFKVILNKDDFVKEYI